MSVFVSKYAHGRISWKRQQTPGVGETADSCDVSTNSRRDQYQLEGVSWWVREKLQESGLACACSITQPLRPHAHGQSTSEATAPMWEHDAAQILAGWCVSSLLFQLTPDARQASPVILFQYLQYYIT